MKKAFYIFAIIALGATISFAQTQTPQINKTQKKQITRIKQGAKSGELTKKETKNLMKEQKKIQKEKAAAKADGVVTKAERKKIKKDQAVASKKIWKKKHNRAEKK